MLIRIILVISLFFIQSCSLFKKDNFSAYGKESPFQVLKDLNGKIAILDLFEQNSMTFYHHIEELNNVEWRYHKIFEGIYEDFENKKSKQKYSIFVRDLDRNKLAFYFKKK